METEKMEIIREEIEKLGLLEMLGQDISWNMKVLVKKYGEDVIKREVQASGFYVILQTYL